ncbi:ABC transporter substrate-binding protein [Streptomyces mirabilis]
MAAGGAAARAALRDQDNPGASTPRAGSWAIGVQADLSGAQRAAGEAQERGARLAVEQFNSRKDKPVALTLNTAAAADADDGGSGGRAQTAARKLIQDTDVLAVLGPTNDETATAVLGTYDEALLPLLCVSAGGLILTSQQYRSFVHCRPSDAAVFPPSNGTTTTHVVPADSADYDPVAAAVLAAGSEAVVYGGASPHRAARLARALEQTRFKGTRMAPEPVLEMAFLTEAGPAAEGWVISATYVDPAALSAAERFVAAYKKRFGVRAVERFALEAYDALLFVAQGLGELGYVEVRAGCHLPSAERHSPLPRPLRPGQEDLIPGPLA